MKFSKSVLRACLIGLSLVMQSAHAEPNTVIGCVNNNSAEYPNCSFSKPIAVAITPNGKKAYVCNVGNNSVSVIDVVNDIVIGCVNDAACNFKSPFAVAITPDGQKAYVCNLDGDDSVTVIDVASDTATKCIATPFAYAACAFDGPIAIAMTPLGITPARAYICDQSNSAVSVVDVASDTMIACVEVPSAYLGTCGISFPDAIAITPDGSKVYVCNTGGSGSVSVIDTATNMVIDCVTNPYGYSCGFNFPSAIVITPIGVTPAKAYVSNFHGDSVTVIDLASNTITGCVDVPYAYAGTCRFSLSVSMAITPDGTTVYVGNNTLLGRSVVSVIDVASDSVVDCIEVPSAYSSCAFANPGAIAITPNGLKAYVCNHDNASVTVIEVKAPPVFPPIDLTGCILQKGNTITNSLSWDAPTSGSLPTSYNIYRNFVLIATVPAYGYGPFVYEDVDLNPSGSYTYSITSVFESIESSPASITVSSFCYPELFPPTSLGGCTIQQGNTVINTITWAPPTYGATPIAYEIYRDSYLYELIATVSAAGPLSYQDTETAPYISYIYYIVSVDSHGDKSEPASVTITQECISIFPPASVNGCKTQNIFLLQTDFINNVTWTAPASGTAPVAYKIYRDAALTELMATVPANGPLQYFDHNRNPGIIYSYYIVSVDGNGNQSTANSVTVTNPC